MKFKQVIKESNCNHKRIKRNFPHGRKSKPIRVCKDCKIIVPTHTHIQKVRRKKNDKTRL